MFSLRRLFLLTAALSTAVHAAGTVTVINQCSNTITMDAGSASTLATGATSGPVTYGTDTLVLRVYTDDASNYLAFEAVASGGMVYYDISATHGFPVDSFAVASSSGDCPSIACGGVACTAAEYSNPNDAVTESCADGSSFTWTLCA